MKVVKLRLKSLKKTRCIEPVEMSILYNKNASVKTEAFLLYEKFKFLKLRTEHRSRTTFREAANVCRTDFKRSVST